MLEQESQQYHLRKYPQDNARCEWGFTNGVIRYWKMYTVI